MPDTKSAAVILAEHIAERSVARQSLEITYRENMIKRDAVIAAALIAIPVVLRAGYAGNVQCKEAIPAILAALKPLDAFKPKKSD